MAGIFDFLSNSAPEIPDAVKDRRLIDWQNSTTQAGDDALRARQAAEDLARDRAYGQGRVTAERQAAQRAAALSSEAWGRSGAAATLGEAAGTLGRAALGAPGAGLQALTYSPDVGEGSELSPQQIRQEMGPANAFAQEADAGRYAQRVQGNAKAALQGYQNLPVSLMANGQNPDDAIADQQAVDTANAEPQPDPVIQTAEQNNDQPPVVNTPVGKAVPATPVNTEQAAAVTAQQTEAHRQQLEQGALVGLSTGEVSRPKLAQAVVEADLTRSGKTLTPEEQKGAVTKELGNMKGMDNAQLSKYISYALIAGGVLAALFDKSGNAANMFAQGFTSQLDRNLKYGIQQQKNQMAQAKLDQAMVIQQGNWKRDDRGLDIKEADQASQAGYRTGQLGLGQQRVDVSRQSEARQASQGAANIDLRRQGLGLRQQQLNQTQANADRDYNLKVGAADRDQQRVNLQGESNAIRAAGVAAKANSVKPGVPLTNKEATKLANDSLKQQGVDANSATISTIAAQIQNKSKTDPRWGTNPTQVIGEVLNSPAYEVEQTKGIFGFGGGPQLRQKKQ